MSTPLSPKQQRAMYYVSLWIFVAGCWKSVEVIAMLFGIATGLSR